MLTGFACNKAIYFLQKLKMRKPTAKSFYEKRLNKTGWSL